jgi:CAAX protease family protein
MPEPAKPDALSVILRIGLYVFLAIAGEMLFPAIIYLTGVGIFITSALGLFAAGAVANAIAVRIWERGQLADIGLGWTHGSGRNLLIGLYGGAGAGALVILVPVAMHAASLVHTGPFEWPSLIFVSVVLLFGAVGEEMLFRGYAFQLLLGYLGPFATILPFAVLFALAHLNNPNQGVPSVSLLAPFNTLLWGILFGWAFVRSGDLWLPIGLHFGWNWMLPLFGVNLSGFTMGVTGLTTQWHVGVLWSGGQYGPEGGLLTTVVVIVLAYYLYRAPVAHHRPFLVRFREDF